METQNKQSLLEVQDLKKYFSVKTNSFSGGKGYVKAVDGVSFSLEEGETLGIVGESGCGKSTMAKTVIRLLEPTAGKILLEGEDFARLKGESLKEARKKIKLIFQDPYSSLNARITVKDIIGEYLDIAKTYATRSERNDRIAEVMEEVGLDLDFMDRYPHEFSGGQRQRIGIARAIVLSPKLVLCDEPVSALDVSIQAKIINLLMDLQKRMHMGYIFISHDLSVVKHISDRVGVMYLGHLVELADRDELYRNPMNPYTKALFSAIPRIDGKGKTEKIVLSGDVPNPANPPSGCCFHTRCPYAMDVCRKVVPQLRQVGPGHLCACHLHGSV
jgi:oligopeptide/dipeptide ABC transporter ATP-binding protein